MSPEKEFKSHRGTRPGGAPAGTSWLTTYLPLELHSAMRDAYMWQLDHTTTPATSIARWIGQAVMAHCQRTPQERADMAEARPVAQVAGTKGHAVRPYAVPVAALDALAEAEVTDRAQGISTVRNGTATTAIWVAVEETRRDAGGTLPHYIGRLPSKPQVAATRKQR